MNKIYRFKSGENLILLSSLIVSVEVAAWHLPGAGPKLTCHIAF